MKGAANRNGYLGTFQLSFANAATTQVSLDLIIALTLILVGMWNDARQQGRSAVPYVVITGRRLRSSPVPVQEFGLEAAPKRT
ncbi:MAG TPA: hypothetical protein VLI07_01665 [Candidatus Binatus sp.]|nr:hypothetical protein [Candidatus Binatus sp.]